MPSSSVYTSWIQDEEVRGIIARKKNRIIAQRWFHPFEFSEDLKEKTTRAYWIHNTKIHPKYQNRGIYRALADFSSKHLELDEYPLVSQISASNKRMQHVAKRHGFEKKGRLSLNVLIFLKRRLVDKRLSIRKNPPKIEEFSTIRIGKWHVQNLPGETNVRWFRKDCDNKSREIWLRLSSPIHPIQGRSLRSVIWRTNITMLDFHVSSGKMKQGESVGQELIQSITQLKRLLGKNHLLIVERQKFNRYFRNLSLKYFTIPINYEIFLKEPSHTTLHS